MDATKLNGRVLSLQGVRAQEDKENKPLTNGAASEPGARKVSAHAAVRDVPSPVLARRRSSSFPRNAQSVRWRASEEARTKSLLHDPIRDRQRDPRGPRDRSREGGHAASNGVPRASQSRHTLAGHDVKDRGRELDESPSDLNGHQQTKSSAEVDSASTNAAGSMRSQNHGKDARGKSTGVAHHHSTPAKTQINGIVENTTPVEPFLVDGASDEPSENVMAVSRERATLEASYNGGLSSLPLGPASIRRQLLAELASGDESKEQATSPLEGVYESAGVKLERLINFLLLPPQLERVLCFGTLACFDAWLYVLTILPLRCLRIACVHARYWTVELALESRYLGSFILVGLGRLLRRYGSVLWSSSPVPRSGRKGPRRSRSDSETKQRALQEPRRPSISKAGGSPKGLEQWKTQLRQQRHRETMPVLSQADRADLLKFFVTLTTAFILMKFDASMIYHSIRGQATIKLYVIYNVLEVLDRLLSAFGQDVLEVLVTHAPRPNPTIPPLLQRALLLGLACAYATLHATALLLQVVTLNVAVNSHSNALLTLLMSNQFVEIKGTVFKRFDRESLFQMTGADVVERFQLACLLAVIVARNLVEGGSGPSAAAGASASGGTGPGPSGALPPGADLLPAGLGARLPGWLAQLAGPPLLVLGTEALIDWAKHAFVAKFNNVRPRAYARFLDVLARDVAARAPGVDPDLTRRLGLPVLPLAALVARAAAQTGRALLATHFPAPLPGAAGSEPEGPLLRALAAAVPSLRTAVAVAGVAGLFGLLLALKLLLGAALLAYARARSERHNRGHPRPAHNASASAAPPPRRADEAGGEALAVEGARRKGAWGVVEVGEERRRLILDGESEGKRGGKVEPGRPGRASGLDGVERYKMVGKRIW